MCVQVINEKRMKKIFDWIINHFTYIQIYLFICLLFLISVLPIAFFWIQTHLEHLKLIDKELVGINEEIELTKIYHSIQQHRLLTQRYLRNQDKETLNQILQLGEINREAIKKGGERYYERRNKRLADIIPLWQVLNPFQLQKKWNGILSQVLQASPREGESMHNILLHEIEIEFSYLANRTELSPFNQNETFILIQSLLLRLPSLQESLSQLILLSEKILTNPGEDFSLDRAFALIELIESDLIYFVQGLESHPHLMDDPNSQQIFSLTDAYISSVSSLINQIKTKILDSPKPSISLLDFKIESKNSLQWGYQLWEESLRNMLDFFKIERSYIFYRLWGIVFTTIVLIGCAFLLGYALTLTGIQRLTQLTQATNSFTQGNLSVRVDDSYSDDIGRQSHAFNQMAQKLEELIKHLYEIIDATSELSKGNLATRIQSKEHDSEFNQVAFSFNHMAETFETIIKRLKQIAHILTSSASGIADASKEQETSIVNQEKTTREISLAANEISSTAKELAVTMNEVSLAAGQTSDLAIKGKDSLNEMETIMHHMVDASEKIGYKLAILSEKAKNITNVITTITKVADQTNLLSLNASIEAEKAGEYGRGFAVIAREIRRLADQTALATLNIEKMIEEIMSAVSSSVMGVDDFSQEIRKGVGDIRNVSGHFATIISQVQADIKRFEIVNQGMQAQSSGAVQINEAIAQLSQTARQTSESIHQFHKTVQELNQAANELNILKPFASETFKSDFFKN